MATYKDLQNEALDLTYKEVRVKADRMAKLYRSAQKEVQSKLSKVYKLLQNVEPENYATFMMEYNRLGALNSQVTLLYEQYAAQAGLEIERASRIAMSNQFYRGQYANAWFTPMAPINGVQLSFQQIDPVAIEMAVYSTEHTFNQIGDKVRRDSLKGILPKGDRPTLKQLLYTNKRKEIKRIKDRIAMGFVQGWSLSEMAIGIKGVFNQSINNAMRVIRTETNRITNVADYLSWQDAKNKGVEGRRMWLSVLDTRTRAQSAAMDGQEEDENGLFHYPNGATSQYPGGSGVAAYDINERCTTIINLNGVSPLLRRGRNPVTGKTEVTEFETFDKWAERHGIIKNDFGEMVRDSDFGNKVAAAVVKANKAADTAVQAGVEVPDTGLFATDVQTATELQHELINSGVLDPESYDHRSLQGYTSLDYININSYLRTGKPPRGQQPFVGREIQQMNKQIDSLSKVLEEMPAYRNEVYRGARFSINERELGQKFVNQYKVGNIITEKGFTSTSAASETADAFLFGYEGEKVIFNIKSKTGRAIWEFSVASDEREVLFDKGTQFIVNSKKKDKDGIWRIELEEI